MPWLTPHISALWLRLVTQADYSLAHELVVGLAQDLLPVDERYWELTRNPPKLSFDEAARRALAADPLVRGAGGRLGRAEERVVDLLGRRLLPGGGYGSSSQ